MSSPPPAASPSRAHLLSLLALVLLGAFLRLHRLDLMTFGSDQANASFMALDMVEKGQLARFGLMSSLEVLNPPGFIWLLAPAIAVSRDPVWLTAFIALLGIAALPLAYWLASRAAPGCIPPAPGCIPPAPGCIPPVPECLPPAPGCLPPAAEGEENASSGSFPAWLASPVHGLVAVAFLVASPYAVQYSRSIWAQDTLPLLTCIAGACLVLAIARSDGRPLILGLPVLALMLQVHMSAAAFACAFGAALLLGMRRRMWPGLVFGALLGALLFVPFLSFASEHGWRDLNPHSFKRVLVRTGDIPFLWSVGLLGSLQFSDYFLGNDASAFAATSPVLDRLCEIASGLLIALLVYGFLQHAVVTLRAMTRDGDYRRLAIATFMTLWLAFPAIFALRGDVSVYPHYFIVSLPAQAFFAACGGVDLARRAARLAELARWPAGTASEGAATIEVHAGTPITTRVAVAALVALIVIQTSYFVRFNDFLERHPFRTTGDYRITYRFLRDQAGAMVASGNAQQLQALGGTAYGAYLLRHVLPAPPRNGP